MTEPAPGFRLGRGRPPWWLVAAVVVVLGLVVAGNFLTGFENREEVVPTTLPPPTLDALARDADVVALGEAVDLDRLGRPSDPEIVATIEVGEYLRPPAGAEPGRLAMYDRGFTLRWRANERVLVFATAADGQQARLAPYRVIGRYVVRDGELIGPFSLGDARRAVGE